MYDRHYRPDVLWGWATPCPKLTHLPIFFTWQIREVSGHSLDKFECSPSNKNERLPLFKILFLNGGLTSSPPPPYALSFFEKIRQELYSFYRQNDLHAPSKWISFDTPLCRLNEHYVGWMNTAYTETKGGVKIYEILF